MVVEIKFTCYSQINWTSFIEIDLDGIQAKLMYLINYRNLPEDMKLKSEVDEVSYIHTFNKYNS